MSWGKGIIIGMAAFMGFILFLVISLMQHKVDLVSEDYYQQEIDYDTHMNAVNVYNQSKEKIAVKLTEKELQLQFPVTMQDDSIHVQLKRPDNEKLDMKLGIAGMPLAAIPLEKLQKGRYDLIITGSLENKEFIYEDAVTIP